jgi:hypothetical protein
MGSSPSLQVSAFHILSPIRIILGTWQLINFRSQFHSACRFHTELNLLFWLWRQYFLPKRRNISAFLYRCRIHEDCTFWNDRCSFWFLAILICVSYTASPLLLPTTELQPLLPLLFDMLLLVSCTRNPEFSSKTIAIYRFIACKIRSFRNVKLRRVTSILCSEVNARTLSPANLPRHTRGSS